VHDAFECALEVDRRVRACAQNASMQLEHSAHANASSEAEAEVDADGASVVDADSGGAAGTGVAK
jgi:hypothetical protein